MKLYTEKELLKAIQLGRNYGGWVTTEPEILKQLTPIELPNDEEIIGRFMNWFLKHYSTATIDGMFGYVNSMEQEVTIREILNHYFNKEQILGKEDKTFKQKSKWTEVDNMTRRLK